MESSHGLLGRSRAILDVIEEAQRVAATDAKVLITGESGVGKELLARIVHDQSPRGRAPMVTINCAGVPDTLLESELFGHMRGSFTDAHRDRRGLLELADGSTVMLDEVGEMSIRMQTMLLRFLENGEIQRIGSERAQSVVNVRVISATNRNLLERARQKEFREDLYYRLNVVHLTIPPLRARQEDVAILFDHFVQQLSDLYHRPPCQLMPEAKARLEAYDWPGNVRELKNVAERLILRKPGHVVSLMDLPSEIAHFEPPPTTGGVIDSPAHDKIAAACYERLTIGRESFWSVMYEPFMRRDLTRDTVRAVVRRGLAHTRGNYRLLAEFFNLPPTDYKRLLNFLQKYECHMPFQHFRVVPAQDGHQPPVSVRTDAV